MYVSEKIPGGKLLGVEIETKINTISKLQITGDFFLHPEDLVFELEKSLIGVKNDISINELEFRISNVLKNSLLIGASSFDIACLIKKAIEKEIQLLAKDEVVKK